MFCPKCNSLMFPDSEDWVCRKCEHRISKADGKVHEIVTHTGAEKEMMIIDEEVATLPKTKVECPSCGHNEAFWVIRQTRSADEPETRIYRCVKCKHSWREY